MAQAVTYAEWLDVPFAFASNGDGFVFRDAPLATGTLATSLALDALPSPAELWARLCAWKGWTHDDRRPLTLAAAMKPCAPNSRFSLPWQRNPFQ